MEFEEKDDAADATDNMHNAELYGRVLRVNYAQPMKVNPCTISGLPRWPLRQ